MIDLESLTNSIVDPKELEISK